MMESGCSSAKHKCLWFNCKTESLRRWNSWSHFRWESGRKKVRFSHHARNFYLNLIIDLAGLSKSAILTWTSRLTMSLISPHSPTPSVIYLRKATSIFRGAHRIDIPRPRLPSHGRPHPAHLLSSRIELRQHLIAHALAEPEQPQHAHDGYYCVGAPGKGGVSLHEDGGVDPCAMGKGKMRAYGRVEKAMLRGWEKW